MGVCTCWDSNHGRHECRWHSKSGKDETDNCQRCAKVELRDARLRLNSAKKHAEALGVKP